MPSGAEAVVSLEFTDHGIAQVALRNVLRAAANVLAIGGGGTQGDLGDSVVRELEGDDGLGARGHGRAGRDADRGTGHEGSRVDGAGADLLGDGKRHRRLQGGSLTVTDTNGVSVAYIGLPIFFAVYLGYKYIKKTKLVPLKEVNLDRDFDK